MTELIYDKIQRVDDPRTLQEKERKRLIVDIQNITKCDVAVMYHNLSSPYAMLDDSDADMLEAVLSANPPKRSLLLIINSNGGLPLAAERIVHVARTYAPKGFRTMVVQKAKSAATMVCLGSDRIYMTTTAELGPIDPQILADQSRRVSVDSYLDAYNDLMEQLRALDMNLDSPAGLLHQLSKFDAAHVEEMKKVRQLAKDMAGKFLGQYMMQGSAKEAIEQAVDAFSESRMHNSHGRPIWSEEAISQGLKVTVVKHTSNLWKAAYELIQRYDHLCFLKYAGYDEHLTKLLETEKTSHEAAGPLAE